MSRRIAISRSVISTGTSRLGFVRSRLSFRPARPFGSLGFAAVGGLEGGAWPDALCWGGVSLGFMLLRVYVPGVVRGKLTGMPFEQLGAVVHNLLRLS